MSGDPENRLDVVAAARMVRLALQGTDPGGQSTPDRVSGLLDHLDRRGVISTGLRPAEISDVRQRIRLLTGALDLLEAVLSAEDSVQ